MPQSHTWQALCSSCACLFVFVPSEHTEDCEGWSLSGCRSSVAEHWLHKPGVLGLVPSDHQPFYLPLFLPHNIWILFISTWLYNKCTEANNQRDSFLVASFSFPYSRMWKEEKTMMSKHSCVSCDLCYCSLPFYRTSETHLQSKNEEELQTKLVHCSEWPTWRLSGYLEIKWIPGD